VSGSSLGYSMFEHSLQNRKVICSMFFFCSSPELDAGEAMAGFVERRSSFELLDVCYLRRLLRMRLRYRVSDP